MLGYIIIFGSLILYLHKQFIPQKTLIGKYVNMNYDSKSGGEAPCVPDTLILLENNQFISAFFGNGTYEVSHTLKGTVISLGYNYEFGKAGFDAYITRMWFGVPKIIINRDMNHYYEKIKL